MQQIYSTTEPDNEQAAPPAYALPAALGSAPGQTETTQAERTIKAAQEEQEQSALVERLLAALERDTKWRRKLHAVTHGICGVGALAFWIAWGVTWLFSRRHAGILLDHFTWLFLSLQLINALGWLSGVLFLNRKAASTLIRMEDVRCIPTLVDVWVLQGSANYSRKTRSNAEKMLTRLLPRMQASDAPLLKEPQRSKLRGVLANNGHIGFGKYQDADLMLSILKAFEQVGDWKSLPHVQKLAQEAKEPKVRAAALECLPYLQALAEKHKPGENLLRASGASQTANSAPDLLLRPASANETARPETLLRAAGE